MIGPGTGVRRISRRSGGPTARRTVYLACGVTDMRKGIAGLSALAQDGLRQDPASGAVFAFRGRSGDRRPLLYWDGQGFCLYYKVLERGGFPWPSAKDGATQRCASAHSWVLLVFLRKIAGTRLTSAQLAMLWEGSMAGPGLLAHTLISKFDDHLPLYRQAEIFARMGADIPDTTLVGWVKTGPAGIDPSGGRIEGMNARSAGRGRAMKTLRPVIERIETGIMACDLLHAPSRQIASQSPAGQ